MRSYPEFCQRKAPSFLYGSVITDAAAGIGESGA